MTQNQFTGEWDVNEYNVEAEHCSPPKVKPLDYGNDILYDLQGKVVDRTDPEREPWLRENQFRHSTDNWH